MGKVQELVITKGKTIKAGDSEEWVHVEYSIKAVVDSETDLETAKAHLEGLEDGWLTGIAGLASTAPAKAPTPVATSPNSVAALFPKEFADLLAFEEKGEWITIKPKQFLGSENFAKIAKIIKDHSGEYISAGKDSHFRLSKQS